MLYIMAVQALSYFFLQQSSYSTLAVLRKIPQNLAAQDEENFTFCVRNSIPTP